MFRGDFRVATVILGVLLGSCSRRPADRGETYLGNALEILEKNRIASDVPLHLLLVYENEDHTVNLVQVNSSVPLHEHVRHDEVAYILEGGGTFTLAGRTREVKPGDVQIIPRGAPHGFQNRGPQTTAILSVFSPKFDGTDRRYIEAGR